MPPYHLHACSIKCPSPGRSGFRRLGILKFDSLQGRGQRFRGLVVLLDDMLINSQDYDDYYFYY